MTTASPDFVVSGKRPLEALLFTGRFLVVPAICLLLLAGLSGCSEPTTPDPGANLPFPKFLPAEQDIAITPDQFIDFQVKDESTNDFHVTWSRRLFADEIGDRYRYIPSDYGPDTLLAGIAYPDRHLKRRWFIDVVRPEPEAYFLPVDSTLQIVETFTLNFAVGTRHSPVSQYVWTRDGVVVGRDSTYVFEALRSGTEIVRCEVSAGENQFTKQWRIETMGLDEIELPEVTGLHVTQTGRCGEIQFFWDPINSWYVPILEYRILISYDGLITRENRDQSSLLATIPYEQGLPYYLERIWIWENELLTSDTPAWFAIVCVDERGNISPPQETSPFPIPYYWSTEGTVHSIWGEPLDQVLITDSSAQYPVLTDPEGNFRIGPFCSYETVTLSATHPTLWHQSISTPITDDIDHKHDFLLIPRLGADPDCVEYSEDFLYFFRKITSTWDLRNDRPNFNLYKWDSYPVEIYIPNYITPKGINFGAAAHQAVQIWNDKLGEEYLVPVPDPNQARILMEFGYNSDQLFGLALILKPDGETAMLGSMIPDKVQVFLFNSLTSQISVEVTALHELGHALGLYAHTVCHDVGYLMYVAPSVSHDDWPEHAIHPDELNAVRTVRYLPQGQDMSRYIPD